MKTNFKTGAEVDEIFESLKTEQGLERLEKSLRRLRTHNGVRRIHKLWEDANIHEGTALLLAVHYGTKKELEEMKELILKTYRTSKAQPRRIKLASTLYGRMGRLLELQDKDSPFAMSLNSKTISNK